MIDLEHAIKALIDRDAVTVPPYPGVAMRLQQLVATGNYGMNDLAKVAMADPVVTGFLLRAANSSAYRGAAKISSVSEAVTRIGGADVVRIAIAASLGAESGRKGPLAVLRRRIWQESLTSAVVAFQIANARRLNGQEGFVCGLLHDIGRVVAVSCIETLLAQKRDGRTLSEADWMEFVDRFHVDIGIATARKWALSEVIQTVIASHHTGDAGAHQAMVDVVRAADEVVALIFEGPPVTLERLAALSTLSGNEHTVLCNAIPAIGPFVASMDDAAPAPAVPAPSQVSTPAAVARSDEPVGKADFPITLLRANGQIDGRCYRVAKGGLTFVSKERLQPKYLAKLQLRPPSTAPFEIHATIEACHSDPEGFLCELKLFALGGAAKDRWAELLASVGIGGSDVASAAPGVGARAAVRS